MLCDHVYFDVIGNQYLDRECACTPGFMGVPDVQVAGVKCRVRWLKKITQKHVSSWPAWGVNNSFCSYYSIGDSARLWCRFSNNVLM